MTVFTGLHSLPRGQHMYTLYLASKSERAEFPDGEYGVEEVDAVAKAGASNTQVIAAAASELADLYDMEDMEVIAIADQSLGQVIWQAEGVA